MGLSVNWKRLFLRGLKWDAETNSATLDNTLKAAAQAKLLITASGRVLVSTSGNGRTNTFALPQAGQGASQTDIVEVVEEMFGLYTEARTNLGGSPTDDQVFAEMMLYLVPVQEVENDFVSLRG